MSRDLSPGLPLEHYELDNGLELLVQPDPSAPVVCVQTWFRVGSRHEEPGKTGLAHLLEHLMFLGTPAYPAGEFDRLLEEVGVDTNAATWLDWTFYTNTGPAEALPRILELEADRLAHLAITPAVFRTEREVVRNERRETVDDDPDATASELLHRLAFDEGHPYRHPTIGLEDDIASLALEDCRGFHARHYHPGAASLVVVGDVDPETVFAQVVGHHGAIASGSAQDPRPAPALGRRPPRRHRCALETDTGKLLLGFEAPALGSPRHAAAVVLDEILFGSRGGRAHRELVEERGLCSSVFGDVGHFAHASLWEVELAAAETSELSDIEAAFREVVDGLRSLTADEVARATARLELATWQSLLEVGDRAEQIGFFHTVLGDPAALVARVAFFREMRPETVRDLAEELMAEGLRAVLEVEPEEEPP